MSQMRKQRLYLETSVWNHLVPVKPSIFSGDTMDLFTQISEGRHEIFVSEYVAAEIGNTPLSDRREKLRDAVEKYAPGELKIDAEALALAKKYLAEGVVPAAAKDDALHVAIASVAELDMIVSLNMRHIVRVKTRQGINGVNLIEGYRQIEIATPGEVLDYGRA